MNFGRRFFRDEGGATAVEYGLALTILALLVMGGFGFMGGRLFDLFGNMAGALD